MQRNVGVDNQVEEEAEGVTSSYGNSSQAADAEENEGDGLERIDVAEVLEQERLVDERRKNEEATDHGNSNSGDGSWQEPIIEMRPHVLDVVRRLNQIKNELYEAGVEFFKKMKEIPDTFEEVNAMEQEFGGCLDNFTSSNNNIELVIATVIRSCSFTENDRNRNDEDEEADYDVDSMEVGFQEADDLAGEVAELGISDGERRSNIHQKVASPAIRKRKDRSWDSSHQSKKQKVLLVRTLKPS